MTQEPPAQLVVVAAVSGVGKESFLQVGAQHLEENALRGDLKVGEHASFQLGYQGVLLLRGALGEGSAAAPAGGEIERRQADPVVLSPVSVRTSQRPIQVGKNADLGRAGSVPVGREVTVEDSRRRPCLVGVQNQQGGCSFLQSVSGSLLSC
jgi:hypothetical protein